MQNKYLFSSIMDTSFEQSIQVNDYYLNHNFDSSQIRFEKNKESFIILIGDFIDAEYPMQTIKDTAKNLLNYKDIFDLIEKTVYLAGRYLIFAGDNTSIKYVISDPTVSIPINYLFEEREYVFSSHAKFIADRNGYKQSQEAINIKKGAEQQQPLPYNITMFDEVKTLIPNHYLDVANQKMSRFFPIRPIKEVSMDKAVDETIKISKSIIKGYTDTRKISLPITSGVDSRAVLSLMKEQSHDLKMYTYFHDEFTEETGDIKIPKEISSKFQIDHLTLPIKKIPEKVEKQITEELAGLENHRILNNGYTYSQSELSNHYPFQGDIISLTKSPFGKDLPESWASLNYFITKTHNYSKEVRKYVNAWMKDTYSHSQNYNVSLYDLFNWESRLGRWLPNNMKNYDYFINPVYIFNCRYLTELWVSIPREERTNRSMHMEIIKKEWPELLDIPFNPDDKVIDKVFSNSYMFYFGSFLKYYLKKWL